MTPQKQIQILAGADGWKMSQGDVDCQTAHYEICGEPLKESNFYPDYLTSYDAIIPLIVKWCGDDEDRWRNFLRTTGLMEKYNPLRDVFKSTPSQLSTALIRAMGKWEE